MAISTTFAAILADWFAVAVTEAGAAADGYVWAGRGGDPMNANSASQKVARVLVRAASWRIQSATDETPIPLVTLHGLGHTRGSILLARGVPLIVSRHLGTPHDQLAGLRARASNLWCGDDDAREVVEQLNRGAGYEPVRVGGLDKAAAQEGFVDLIFAITESGLGPFVYRIAPPDQI
jgi:hypothetical protein